MSDTRLVNEPIPYEIAVKLCDEIRAEAEINWNTASANWCYQCRKLAGNDPNKRGFLRAAGNRGCILINCKFAALKIKA